MMGKVWGHPAITGINYHSLFALAAALTAMDLQMLRSMKHDWKTTGAMLWPLPLFLVVTLGLNGCGDGNQKPSAGDSHTNTTAPPGSTPVANAGPDQGGKDPGDLITLDGSASTDPSGDPLTYSWTLLSKPAGSAAVLVNPKSVSPTFSVDIAGIYTAQLIVNDGTADSTPDKADITTGNVKPVANAGPDQGGKDPGDLITLDGSASFDPNGDPLAFNWKLLSKPAGSKVNLPNPTGVSNSFVVDQAGTYTAELIVNDGTLNSVPDDVNIVVGTSGTIVRTTLATDNFNRPNSADFGSAWDAGYDNKTPAMIVSQQVQTTETNLSDPKSAESYNAKQPADDQWCQFTLVTWTGLEDREFGCILRAQPPPTVAWYWCYARVNGARNAAIVSHHEDQSQDANLASNFSVVWGAGDKLRCEAQGTSLRLYRIPAGTASDTLLLSVTDGEYTSGRAGLLLWMGKGPGTPNLVDAAVDDFAMGSIVSQ